MAPKDTESNDFFIGWKPDMPPDYARRNRRFVGLMFLLAVAVAGGLVFSQRGYADSNFELGKITVHEGWLVMHPFPMLKSVEGTDETGRPRIKSTLLLGFGKRGAEATIAAIEKKQNQSLSGRSIRLRGTRIYHADKAALELTEGVASFAGFSEANGAPKVDKQSYGRVSLLGEILDPKCALGVMKPGYGKPHRSCAVRCIAGGIPPVLRVMNTQSTPDYFLVVGPEGKPVNQQLLSLIADQVQICGRLEQKDDWWILYTDPAKDIIRLGQHWDLADLPMCNQSMQ